eukprot:GHVT01048617.1.p1 GENE.GHVT01048617.1~~GHVT01048617.1.p1  ORF type:complete len:626 (-),score=145.16 GHVT01048617.1:688-2565(-)
MTSSSFGAAPAEVGASNSAPVADDTQIARALVEQLFQETRSFKDVFLAIEQMLQDEQEEQEEPPSTSAACTSPASCACKCASSFSSLVCYARSLATLFDDSLASGTLQLQAPLAQSNEAPPAKRPRPAAEEGADAADRKRTDEAETSKRASPTASCSPLPADGLGRFSDSSSSRVLFACASSSSSCSSIGLESSSLSALMAHILSDQAVRVTTALAPEYSSSATSFEQAVSSVSSSLQLYPSAGLGVVPWRDLDKQIKKRIEILRIGMSQAEELVAAVTRQTPTVAKATNADTRDANEKKQQKSNGTENNNNATTSNANAEQQQLDDALQDAHKFALLIHAAVQRLEEFRGLLLSLSHKILKRNLAKSPSDVSLDDIQLQKREEFAEAARREADRETRCDAIRYILDRSIERKATHRNDHPLFVLGIDPKLATVEIVKNFRKRVAFLTHPDKVEESQKQNATEATALINQALPEALQLLRCARGFDPNSYAAPPSPPFYELVGREAPSAPATTGKPNNASASSSEAVERAIPGSPLWLPSRLVFPDVEICPPRGPTVTGACHVTVFAPEASAGLSKITKVQLYVHRPYFASRPPQVNQWYRQPATQKNKVSLLLCSAYRLRKPNS